MLRWLVLLFLAIWLPAQLATPPSRPADPPPVQVQQRMEDLLATGQCWNDLRSHPFPQHAFFLTPTTGLHYGPSGPALAIVFGPDRQMYTGDEAPGAVYAFCR